MTYCNTFFIHIFSNSPHCFSVFVFTLSIVAAVRHDLLYLLPHFLKRTFNISTRIPFIFSSKTVFVVNHLIFLFKVVIRHHTGWPGDVSVALSTVSFCFCVSFFLTFSFVLFHMASIIILLCAFLSLSFSILSSFFVYQ